MLGRDSRNPPRLLSLLLAAAHPLTSVPILHSLPGASDFLYLDVDGDFQARWGSSAISRPPPTTRMETRPRSAMESSTSIQDIWKQVAEDYAPFRIDVTTEQPSSLALGTTMKVDIGGNGSWTGGTYGGIAYVNGFTSGPNVGFVFPANLANGTPKYTGDASAHEAGHGFGLQHQSQYDSSGNKLQDYYSGPGDGTAPLMGTSYSARRSLWWYGTSTSATTYQNDMDVIARGTNGFGYRTDEAGDTASTASPLTVVGTSVSASGIITTMSDLDYYSFTTNQGNVSFTVTVPTSVSNLAPKLELRSADRSTLIASAGPSGTNFSASLTASLSTGGSYRLVVQSNGTSSGATSSNYGFNVGSYAVNGTIVTSTDSLSPPSGLTATSVNTSRIDLSWHDNASNETGYQVERSSDGTTWSTIAGTLPANSTTYSDASAAPGSTYYYRVRAINGSTNSDYSNQATATTITLPPSSLVGNATSPTRVSLTWGNVSGETGYRVERSLDGSTWSQIGTTGLNVTTYADTTVSPNTTYQYRVEAVNAGGTSDPSNVVTVTTPTRRSPPRHPRTSRPPPSHDRGSTWPGVTTRAMRPDSRSSGPPTAAGAGLRSPRSARTSRPIPIRGSPGARPTPTASAPTTPTATRRTATSPRSRRRAAPSRSRQPPSPRPRGVQIGRRSRRNYWPWTTCSRSGTRGSASRSRLMSTRSRRR